MRQGLVKTTLFDIIVVQGTSHHRLSMLYDFAIVGFVVVNLITLVLETDPVIGDRYASILRLIDGLTVAFITVDYVLRLWVMVEDPQFQPLGPVWGRLAYALSPLALIDLVAILPFYASLLAATRLEFLLVLRLLRVLKLARYSPAISTVIQVVVNERKALIASLFLLSIALVMSAGMMFVIEAKVQPESFGTLGKSLWWAIITLTTVGYGDVVPSTPLGRVLAGITGVAGIVLCAVPAGILASGFVNEIKRRDFVVTWRLVAKVPLFASLDADKIAAITDRLRIETAPGQANVLHMGEPGDSMYFIVEGMVRADFPGGSSRLGPGEFFGELALLSNAPRMATITAITDCRFLVLDRTVFEALMEEDKALKQEILEVAQQRAPEVVISL